MKDWIAQVLGEAAPHSEPAEPPDNVEISSDFEGAIYGGVEGWMSAWDGGNRIAFAQQILNGPYVTYMDYTKFILALSEAGRSEEAVEMGRYLDELSDTGHAEPSHSDRIKYDEQP